MDLDPLSDLLDEVSAAYAARNGIERTADWFALKLQEELGELTQAYLMERGQARSKGRSADELRLGVRAEVADVLAHLLLLAKHHDIDVMEALEEKWLVHHPCRSHRWKRGEVITWTYKDPAFPNLIDCRPVTVVDDDEEGLVVWLAPGTRMLHQVLEDGEGIRTLDGAARFTSPRTQAVRTWSGSGILAVFQPDTMYSVWFFETHPGVRDTYYINIEQPYLRTANGIESTDLVLDVVASGTGYKYKDEDELAFAREAGVIDDALHERIRGAAEQAIATFEARGYPFNAGYEQFEPDPSWPIPTYRPN